MKNLKKSLLNVPYDRKTEGLKALTYRTYNREHRVPPTYDQKRFLELPWLARLSRQLKMTQPGIYG